jgi:hypothetical protein
MKLQQGVEIPQGFEVQELSMQRALSQAILDRHHGPRYAVAVILVAACSGLSATALAQSDPSRLTNGQGRMSAPIGHRQPRALDLPPDVLRDEGMTPQPPEPAPTKRPDASLDQGDQRVSRTPLDDDLQICRQC